MKIEFETKVCSILDIKAGDCFQYNEKQYMCGKEKVSRDSVIAMDLNTGDLAYFDKSEQVLPLVGKITFGLERN